MSSTSTSLTQPMPNQQRDSGLKYQRGCDHFDWLEAEWKRFIEAFIGDLNVARSPGELRMRLDRFSELPARELSVVVGDCVGNFRAALDHMAWQLSSARERRDHPARIEFPVFGDQARYQSEAPRKIAGVATATATAIAALQPYHRNTPQDPNAYTGHPLWQLHELATIDKHRRLHIGHVSIEAVTVSVGSQRLATTWRAAPPAVRAQQGMALATIAEAEIRRFGPPGQVLVEPSAVLTVAFEDSGTVTGEGVMGTLRRIRDAVADVLVQLEPYIGIV